MAHLISLVSKISPIISAMNSNAKSNSHLYAQQGAYLKLDRRSKQFITGYNLPYGVSDEDVLKAQEGDPLFELQELVKERQYLEKALAVSLTGGEENKYLSDLYIVTKRKNEVDVIFDLHNPEDLLKYRALLANNIVAESLEATRGAKKGDYLYYFSDPQAQEKRKKRIIKIKNKIKSQLSKYEDNKVWLFALAKKLDIPAGYDASEDTLYTVINDTIDRETAEAKLTVIETFVNLPVKDVEFYLVWYIGSVTLTINKNASKQLLVSGKVIGSTDEEAQNNLKNVTKYKESYDLLREVAYKKLKLI